MKRATIAALVVLAACASGDRAQVGQDRGGVGQVSDGGPQGTSYLRAQVAGDRTQISRGLARGAQAAKADPALPAAQRKIIRTANVSLVVEDAAASLQRVIALVEGRGGYVADQRQWRQDGQVRATATLRVPAEKLVGTLREIRKEATRIDDETVRGEDVSQEFVDLQAQLTTLQATERELRHLLGTIRRRTQQASQILEVYDKLTTIRGEIERIQGRMRFIDQMVAMSTIKIALLPDALAKPIIEPGWRPVSIAKTAARTLVVSVRELANALIWVVVLILPLALIAFAVFRPILRSWRRRRRSRIPAEGPPSASTV